MQSIILKNSNRDELLITITKEAYEIADAMIKVRNLNNEKKSLITNVEINAIVNVYTKNYQF